MTSRSLNKSGNQSEDQDGDFVIEINEGKGVNIINRAGAGKIKNRARSFSEQFMEALPEIVEMPINQPSDDDININNRYNFKDPELGIDKYVVKTPNMKWGRAEEIVIAKYITKSVAYKSLYNDAYFKYILYYNLIQWPLVIFTCVSIALQIIASTLSNITESDDCSKGKIVIIISAVSSIITAIITYIYSKTQYDRLATGCRRAGSAFSEFADQLRTILAINRNNRANSLDVISNTQKDYLRLKKIYGEFEIPRSIYRKFINKYRGNSALIDITTDNNNEFELHDGILEKNMVVDRFIDAINKMREKDKLETPQSSMSTSMST